MSKLLIILQILLVSAFSLTDKQIIQQTLNGIFAQNKLPEPTTIVPCYDDASAKSVVTFTGDSLNRLAKGSVSDFIAENKTIYDYIKSLPQQLKNCLIDSPEFNNIGLKYGIDKQTNMTQIQKKMWSYLTLRYYTVHKWFGQLNQEWKAEKYYQAGFNGASYTHNVLASPSMELI